MKKLTFVVDIDDTLLMYPDDKEYKEIWMRYIDAQPDQEEIDRLNKLYKSGHIIILHTGRNWDKYELTVKQMADHNINYHQLVMGKPWGIYVDKDSKKTIRDAISDLGIKLD